ncbi:flavin-containing monooxygenase [Rhodococcus sp. T7]|uniref:flavin-containing monooxygenase n=1 Tax=Rhodococcus sp. T7 TaxID=627444 RepID=UPI0013C677A3|nr:NAD(P)/FAD-dependent oxidoreductase [Rhodococcus sp. T7]KAF0960881.1 Phenylacetone monooxygenase [Rhodococcus sp. T7]
MQDEIHEPEFDVVVVGAGFSGLYLAHRATRMGLRVRVLEAGADVGGTWYWNTYPGARCDVESIDYSYSFSEDLQQEWVWSERFAPQQEILAYINHVADRFDLRRHIEFNTRVTAARFTGSGWELQTDTGDTVRATFCVMASGGLSAPKKPDFPGLDDFRGQWFHTARWPAEGVDFRGKRVAVVGTGSTGIQVIPKVAEDAENLIVLQRTPNYTVPARNRRLTGSELDDVKADYAGRRARARRAPSGVPPISMPGPGKDLTEEERTRVLEAGWQLGGAVALLRAFSDTMTDLDVNETVGRFVRSKIAEIVDDPETAAALSPTDYPFGAKRLCADTDYFATYNRSNVQLVDLRKAPLERITENGIRCGGVEHEVDVIIFAIGFDAISGAVSEIDIRGRDDRTLREHWREGPKAALGLQVAGFPNLFLVNGPGSPAVLGNVVAFAEQNVEWITTCIDYLRRHEITTIETTSDFEAEWAHHVDEVGAATLYVKAKSWYTGENVPGKPRRFLPYAGGLDRYRDRCDEIAANGYEHFVLGRVDDSAAAAAR